MKVLTIVSGGFDPLHSGHLDYIETAALISSEGKTHVLLNSDEWLARKKGRPFMTWANRAKLIRGLKAVHDVHEVDDVDGSVSRGIEELHAKWKDYYDEIVFCNGGDRVEGNTPEITACERLGIQINYNIGGGKTMASSDLLKAWKGETSTPPWGTWQVLYSVQNLKVKELIIQPGKSLSFQRHFKRQEDWFVVRGKGEVFTNHNLDQPGMTFDLFPGETFQVGVDEWHQLRNTGNEDLVIIEIQQGSICDESDIERRELPEMNH